MLHMCVCVGGGGGIIGSSATYVWGGGYHR